MPNSTTTPLWTKTFIGLALTNMAMFISFHMLNATFPFYINEIGGDEAIAGLITGIFSVAAVVFRPLIGWALDNKGRRIVLLIGLLGMVVLPASYAFIKILLLIAILRICHGVLWSCASTASTTAASDIIPQARFGEGMGMFSTGASAAMAIGPLVGLAIMEAHGFTAMFLSSAFFSAIALLLVICAKNISSRQTKERFRIKGSFKSLIDKDALRPSVAMFLFVMPHGAIATFIALYAAQIDITNSGIFFLVMAATTVIVRLLVGRVVDRRGEGPIVITAIILMSVALAMLAFLPGYGAFVTAAALYGLSFGMMPPALQTMAMRIAPEHRRGAAASTFLCSMDLGTGLGSLIAGYLIRYFSYSTMYGLMIFFLLGSLLVYWFWVRKSSSASYHRGTAH